MCNAHCDTVNGPVVIAAQKGLETNNVNLVLIWVQKKDEAELEKAFNNTLSMRKLSPEAKELADMYFFETLVRIHRAGDGVAYTGLKSAETENVFFVDGAISFSPRNPFDEDIEMFIHLINGRRVYAWGAL